MDIANLVIRVTNDGLTAAQRELRRLRDEAEGAERSTSKFSENLKRLAKFGAVSMGALAVAAVKVSGDFEESMNAVRAVSGATGKDFDDMRNLAKKMGSETAFSATEAANGMEYLAMAGMDTQQVLATIPNALSLAAAGSIDLAQSADILSNIMSGMGIAAEESARVADVLAATAAGANTNISSLGEAMKYVAPIAKTMGYSLEEASAAIGVLGNAGIAGGQAGTSLRAIMTRIASDTGAKGTLADLGVTATDSSGKMRSLTDILTDLQVATKDLSSEQQIEIFKDIAGAEAMGGLAVLVDGVANGSLPQLIEKLKESEGAAKRMAEIRMEGLNGAIKGAKSAAEGFLIAIGDAGLLDLAASGVTMLADGIRSLSEWLPQAAADVTAFFQSAEVATALEMAMEGLTVVWGVLVEVVLASVRQFERFSNWLSENEWAASILEALGLAIGIVAGALVVYAGAQALATGALGIFAGVLALVTSPVTLVVGALVALVAIGLLVYNNWEKIIDVMNDFADVVVGYVVDAFNSAVDAANDFADGIVGWVVDAFNSAVDAANNFADRVVGYIVGAFNNSVDAAKTFASNLWSSISQAFDAVVQVVSSRIDNIKTNFKSGLDIAISIVKGAFDVIKTVVKTVLDVIKAVIKGDFSAIPNIIKGGLQSAIGIVSGMMTNILNVIKEAGKKLFNIGRDFIQGFINGIKSVGSSVVSAATGMVGNAIAAVKRKQDSASPSKVTTKLGGDFSQGFINGISGKSDEVAKAAIQVAEQAVNGVKNGIASLQKQIALFGNNSSLASLLYDIENTDKYKDVSEQLVQQLVDETRALEQLNAQAKAALSIQDRFAKLKDAKDKSKTDLQGMLSGLEQESPLGKIQAEYEARNEVIANFEQMHTDLVETANEARLASDQAYMDAKRDLMLTQGEALFGDLAGLAKGFAGEQSGIYKALFAVEKGFAIAQSAIAIQQSIAKAMAIGFPANIPIVGQAISQGAGIMSNIKGITAGFKSGGYTGNMGASQVAGVVHGQEYVFDAQATKRIGVDNLNAMRRGDSPKGGDVNVTVNNMSSARVETQDDGNGNLIMTIRDEVKKSWGQLQNPNSHPSKMMKASVQAPRRR